MSLDCPWLSVNCSEDSFGIKEYTQAFPSLGLSDTHYPALITLIGGHTKSRYLRQLIDASPACLASPHHQVNLWNDPKSRKEATPKIYIDCELHAEKQESGRCSSTHAPHRQRTARWYQPGPHSRQTAVYKVYVCYFVSDLGGLQRAARVLAEQIVASTACGISPAALPQALFIVDTSSPVFDAGVAEVKLLQDIRRAIADIQVPSKDEDAWSEILEHFTEVRVLALKRSESPAIRAKLLRNRISSICQSVSAARRASRMLLSYRHIQAFFGLLLDHSCAEKDLAFDYIKASRPFGFCSRDLHIHLKELLEIIPSQAWLWHTICPLVGSALFLTSYPPGSHSMLEYTIHSDVRQKFLKSVQQEFIQAFSSLVGNGKRSSSRALHTSRLKAIHPSLRDLKSHKTCLCCVIRTPEKVLSCGHAYCDVCVQMFGVPSMTEKNTFSLHECVLCGESNAVATFSFIPPTAGIRILTLDGGGIRGIIELVFLKHLESMLSNLKAPLRSYFDFICGTSAGGLIVLGLFLMEWSVEECLYKFEELAMRTFRRENGRPSSLFQLQRAILSYMRDFKYDSTAIEDAFRLDPNPPMKMFNPLKNGTKVAVTTTTAREVHPCLFTNYNGVRRPSGIGYQVVRAQKHQNDISVGEAASCTSAAPWFFKPKVVKGLGTFQDGGLQHNNPLGISLRECSFLWPERGSPDFAISIGTGTSFEEAAFEPRSPVRDRTLSRLFRALMRSFDGEKAWKDFMNAIPEQHRHRYHRLNLNLDGPEPDIDDVSSMKLLKSQAQNYLRSSPKLTLIRESVFASIFYFELEDIPVYQSGAYLCVGHILCRLNLCKEGRKALYKELRQNSYYFLLDGHPIRCMEATPRGVPLYRKRIQFKTASIDQQVSITIGGIAHPRYISGLPKSLRELIKQQKLDAPFGRVNHHTFGKRVPSVPLKRKRSSLESGEYF
ncbi:acyl transferase/acyl hydrolase/lysophospholipase [Macrophomina phaseolina]|uniref:Acyl transferase/acyl hydrolase/lysophospholipase n=1 Tax=Macrophomina phaseolina TaxID=35725 RepID=A0ABQ8GV18_9PEZI|nr:acyl transferase/acyl hydrolase/lysophospholipase [Macrophomina phaseolina]